MIFSKTPQTFPIPRLILVLTAALAVAAFVPYQAATITVDPGTVLQTMRGWEAQGHAAEHLANFSTFADGVMTMAADAGINRVRLEVYSGDENPVDNWAIYKAAGMPNSGPAKSAWNATRYEAINDDSDPNHITASGFHFTQIDDEVNQIVNPLRAKVAARGETLYVNLCYVAFTNGIASGIYVHQNPAEYAEFLLATFQHLQATYGWVPNAVEVILEPENSAIWSATSGTLIGQAIKAAGDKLAAAGFHPDFIAPSVTNNDNGPAYIDHIVAVSGAMPYVKEFSYHRYGGVSIGAIASRAVAQGVGASMLEWWDAGMSYNTLYDDLTTGRNSAWQQGALATEGPSAFGVTVVDGNSPTVTKNIITGYTQLYFRHVRFGATRIGASSTDGTFAPLAFINLTGAYTVVVKAGAGGTFTVQGLPAGTYSTRYTTASEVDAAAPDQTISAGQALNASIPAAGVIVAFATAGPAGPPGSFAKASPANGSAGLSSSATLNWSASTGATGYAYCLDTTNNGACDTAWVNAGSATSAVVSNLLPGMNYYWQVRGSDASGQTTYADGSSSSFWSFSTQVGAPAAFGKTGPPNGSTGLATSVALGWNASGGATSYDYCIDTTNNGVCDTSWIPVGASLGAGLSGLAGNTTYYWQVRANNAAGTPTYADGGSGVFWSFKTQVGAPGTFGKSSPASGTTGLPTSVTLNWTASAGATGYEYCLDTTNNGVCDGVWAGVGASLAAGVGGLAANTTYYWQVRASNASGTTYADGSAAAFAPFTTQVAPPGAFSKGSPATGAAGLASSLTLTWNASAGASGYEYCLDTVNNGACDTSWIAGGPVLNAALSSLLVNTTYYWQVRATNASGTTIYADGLPSAFWSFTTGAAAGPGAFVKTTPLSGVTMQPTGLLLSWGFSAGATSYEYCYDTTNDGACVDWHNVGWALQAIVVGLLPNSTYYWQVRALNDAGGATYANGSAAAFWSLSTITVAPGAFAKAAPVSGATGLATSLNLSWGASASAADYEYCLDAINNNTCDNAWISTGGALTAAVSGLSAGTTYFWQVRATAPGTAPTYADGASTSFWSLTTQVAAPGSFGKTAPANGATGQATALSLTWSASAGATSYEYCLDTTNNNVCDTAWSPAGSALSVAVTTSLGGTYSWHVRATNASGTTTYADNAPGAFWSFQTIAGQKAQLVTPAPGSSLTSDTVTFTWTGGVGATQYRLQVGTAPGGGDVADVNTGTALTTVVALPVDGESLFVRLQSLISGAWQFNDYTLTAARIFTIQKAELVSPAPQSTLTASTVPFEWTGGSGATAYRLSIGSASGASDLFDADAGTDLTLVVSGLPNDGRPLFVRLWSQFDGVWEFNDYEMTATTQVLRKAELTTPAPGSSLTSSTVTFQWSGGTGVTATRLTIGTMQGAADLLDRDVTAQVDTVVENLPTDGRTLFVRLWSLVGGVWQWHDATLTAATMTAPVLAELISPAGGSTLTESTVKFAWTGGTGVSAYWLSIGSQSGAADIATLDPSSQLSAVVTGLPTDGRALYVRLFSLIGETWRHNDYVMTAATIVAAQPAELTRPAPESTLTSSAVTFEWTGGAGVTGYRLAIGSSVGASDLVDFDAQTSLSASVAGLPTDGRVIFVRLSSRAGASWIFRDYTYHAMTLTESRPAELLSPAAGSKLESTTVQFRWSGGVGVTHYKLTIGTAPGSDDIASLNVETVLSAFIPNLPADGRRIYVRLYSFMNGAWEYRDYVLTAAGDK